MPPLKPLFSHRHRAALFETKTLKPSFSRQLRSGILQVLGKYSDAAEFENWTFDSATALLCTTYGRDQLTIRDGVGRRPASFHEMILQGYPTEVLDGIEAWFACEPRASEPAAADLNTLLSIHR